MYIRTIKEIQSLQIDGLTLNRDDLKQIHEDDLSKIKKVFTDALCAKQSLAFLADTQEIAFEFHEGDLFLRTEKGSLRVVPTSQRKYLAALSAIYARAQEKRVGKFQEKSPSYLEREARVAKCFQKASKERVATDQAKAQSRSSLLEINAILMDLRSLITNGWGAWELGEPSKGSPWAGPLKFFSIVPLVSGIIGVGMAGNTLHNAYNLRSRAYERDDEEGKHFSALLGGLGLSYAVSATNTVVYESAVLAKNSAVSVSSAVFGAVAGYVTYASFALTAIAELKMQKSFRSQLYQIVSQTDRSEEEKLSQSLRWLHNQVILSPLEEIDIRTEALRKGKDPSQAIERALQKKWDRFNRRAGGMGPQGDLCHTLRTLPPNFFEKIQAKDPGALELSRQIIYAVSKENGKKIASNWLLLVIAILGIISLVFAAHLSGTYGYILGGSAALLWLFLDWTKLNQWMGDKMFQLQAAICEESLVALYPKGWNSPEEPSLNSLTLSDPKKGCRQTPSLLTAGISSPLPIL